MLISVIVPAYNVEAYLNRCIDSILSQTFPDFELILVDDGSPDYCGAICDEYEKIDSRVYVIHQPNGGLSAARNAGIERALESGSEWLTFIDSDDWVHCDYLKELLNGVEDTGCDISSCSFQRTDGVIKDIGNTGFSVMSPEDFWVKSRVNATVSWGKLFRRKYFETIRFPVGKLHEDEFTTYKCLFACDGIAVTKAEMYYYFQNPAGIMKSEWSPKRLALAEAFGEQISFFHERHISSAWEISEKSLLSYLAVTYKKTKASKDYSSLSKPLKKKLKEEFRSYGKTLGLNVNSNTEIYLALYPIRTNAYLYSKAVINTLKSDGVKGFAGKIKRKLFKR